MAKATNAFCKRPVARTIWRVLFIVLPLRPTRLADGLGLGSRPTTETSWIRPAERLHQASTLCWVPRIRLPGDSDLGRFLLCPAPQGPIGATIETGAIIVLQRWVSNRIDFLEISLLSLLER